MFEKRILKMKLRFLSALLLTSIYYHHVGASSSLHLTADGHTDVFQKIRKAFGGSEPYESPGLEACNHGSYGPHIAQEYNGTLKKSVFAFRIHTTPDNDRCHSPVTRQRNEIKIYGSSHDEGKGRHGDKMSFSWKFKIDGTFKTSSHFCHLHQLKASGGDDGDPLITISPEGSKMKVIHHGSSGGYTTIAEKDLSSFKGEWIQATENAQFNDNGRYSLILKRVRDGSTLLSISKRGLDMWRHTDFIRPKWGIYRSLEDKGSLGYEKVLFDQFCIAKGSNTC